jgi:SAM-dependent methyltransferase
MKPDKYQETFQTWDKLASVYQDKFLKLDLYNESYDFICDSLVKQNSKLLEIGCGPGNISQYLLSKRPDFDLFGIDISPNMIKLAKKNNPTARFEVMDSRNIDQIQDCFDGIILGFCLPYLSALDCQKLMKDVQKRIHDKGLIYISFVEGNPDESGFKQSGTGDRVYFYYHSLEELKSLLTENHFHQFHVFNVDFKRSESEIEVHTILIAKKK